MIVFALASTLANAAGPTALRVQADPRGRDLLLIEGAQRKAVRLGRILEIGGPIQQHSVLADSGPGPNRYVLLQVDTLSRVNGGSGYCGAGIETDLVWLALDAKLEARKHDAYRIASCLDSIEPDQRSDQDDGSLRLTLLRPGRDGQPDREVTVRYDAADPAQGLQVHDRVK